MDDTNLLTPQHQNGFTVNYAVRIASSRHREHQMAAQNYYHNPCLICGGTSFSWGALSAQGDELHFYDRAHGGMFVRGEETRSRRCNVCGNVLIFTRPPQSQERSE